MGDDIKRKQGRGRPKKDECYDKVFKFWASEEHGYMKSTLEDELGKNGGEILREALEILYRFKGGDNNE